METWIDEIQQTFKNGNKRPDRTGVGTVSRFGVVSRYPLDNNAFNLVTTKFTSFHSIKHELLWMLRGDTNVKYLIDNRVTIWNEWIKPETAVVRLMTVNEIVKATTEVMSGNLQEIVSNAEDFFTDMFGKSPKYFNSITVNEDDHNIYLEVPRMTGETDKDWGNILVALLNHIFMNIAEDAFEFYDHVAQTIGLYDIDYEDTWKEAIQMACCEKGQCGDTWPVVILEGDLGPVYGKQLVAWQPGIDPCVLKERIEELSSSRYDEIPQIIEELTPKPINQVANVVDLIKNNPDSRRIFISMWNVGALKDMALEPCHVSIQFYSEEMSTTERCSKYFDSEKGKARGANVDTPLLTLIAMMDNDEFPTRKLSSMLYMRSNDAFLGSGYNLGCYSLLTAMIAHVTNHELGEFIFVRGDHHIYLNHFDQVSELLTRKPMKKPKLVLNPEIKDIFDFTGDDITIVDYNSHPAIKAPVAV